MAVDVIVAVAVHVAIDVVDAEPSMIADLAVKFRTIAICAAGHDLGGQRLPWEGVKLTLRETSS